MIQKLKRYLGNTNSLEVHDTANEQTNCQLDEIKAEHRRWYDTLQDAKARPRLRQLRLVHRRTRGDSDCAVQLKLGSALTPPHRRLRSDRVCFSGGRTLFAQVNRRARG